MNRKYLFKDIAKLRLGNFIHKEKKSSNNHDSRTKNLLQENF